LKGRQVQFKETAEELKSVHATTNNDHPLKKNLLTKLQTLKTRAIRIILSQNNDEEEDEENQFNKSNGASTCVSDDELEDLIKEIEEQTSFFLTYSKMISGPVSNYSNYGSKLSEIYHQAEGDAHEHRDLPPLIEERNRLDSFIIEDR
jgi:predicted RNase H-like nuclease (RuvC/YqgF family)